MAKVRIIGVVTGMRDAPRLNAVIQATYAVGTTFGDAA